MLAPTALTAPYVLADVAALGPIDVAGAVEEMAQQGVRSIQLRAKPAPSDRDLFRLTEECCRRLEGTGARLWIDDRADLAALLPLAGVHLGQEDLPPAAARAVVGEDSWLGLSTHNEEQWRGAEADPEVDLIAVGPIFATTSKRNPGETIGLEGLRAARRVTSKPLVAIGGIGFENLGEVLATGVDSVAVLGAVCAAEDIAGVGRNCRRLLAAVEEAG